MEQTLKLRIESQAELVRSMKAGTVYNVATTMTMSTPNLPNYIPMLREGEQGGGWHCCGGAACVEARV